MEIVMERRDGILLIRPKGRLDATTFSELETKIQACLVSQEKKLLFDLSGLEYISSAGLRVFAKTIKQMASLKGQMVLCGMQEQVRKVFDIAGFTSFFTIRPDAAQGFSWLGAQVE